MTEREVPLYLQVKRTILEWIESGHLSPGERVPSEKTLADEMGVSRITTKQALNQLAQEGWVHRARGRGTFVAQRVPPANDTSPDVYGIIVPHLRDSFVTGIVLGVESELVKTQSHLVFRSSDNGQELVESLRDLRRAKVRGIIVWPTPEEYTSEEIVRLRLERFPIVMVDRYLRGVATDCAQSDNLRGGYLATRHLIERGHREIAFVAHHFCNTTSVEERHMGYVSALKEADLSVREERVWLVSDDEDSWGDEIEAALEGQPEVTALFCANDLLALSALNHFHRRGIAVPDRIALIGFDGIDSASTAPIPLSTIRQDAKGIGRAAARLLLDRATGDHTDRVRHIVLPVKLLARASTGAKGRSG